MALLLAGAPAAQAQDETRQAEAHALFVSGRDAAESGLWSEAVDRFSRSYELFPTAAALYNLAVAMRSLGRHIEAREALARLLSDHAGDLTDAQASDARALLAAESVRTARLELSGLDPARRFELRLDGAEREDTGERPLTLELDPGDHRLFVQDEGLLPYTWEGALVEGQRLRLEIALEREPGEDHADDGGSVLESPWFWTIAAAVVIGAGVAAWLLFFDVDRIEPLSDRRYTL